jgi:hypothetical protein
MIPSWIPLNILRGGSKETWGFSLPKFEGDLTSPSCPSEVLQFSALPQAHVWLLSLPVPRMGQAIILGFSCCLMYYLCVVISPAGAICPCC